jgi:hypothetical protein
MIDIAAKFFKGPPKRRVVEVGWLIDTDKSSLIWDPPKPYLRKMPKPNSVKSVQVCPAAIDFDARHFVVPCPVDLHIKIKMSANEPPQLINGAGSQSTVRPKHLNQMIHLISQSEWRDPVKPIVQVTTPYIFLADEVAYVNQVPPYLDYIDPAWPGTLIAGRFPVHIWPRHLMWAFEWQDITKDLILSRGDPWFYVRFDTEDPSRPVRLVEADATPEVRAYIDSISGVTNYVNRTFSLFERAKARRPKVLLVKK